MSNFKDKISNLIKFQAPDFVLEDHPYFLEFIKQYYTFLECAEITLTNIGDPDHIQLETLTDTRSFLKLNGSNQQSDDSEDRILLEDTSYGDFINGEIITGQTSGATTTILVEDIDDGSRLFVQDQNKFIEGEKIIGSTSGAEANIVSYTVNPVNSIQQLLNYSDPDKVIQNFLTKFRNAFLQSIPDNLSSSVDKRKLIKNIKSLYRAKGTKRASEIFFKLLFNENSQIRYPKENILKVSDGKWSTQKVLRCKEVGNNNPSTLVGQLITQKNIISDVNVNKATAIVESVTKYSIAGEQIVEIVLNSDTTNETFVVGQNITGTNNTDEDVLITLTITGLINDIIVTNDGSLYSSNDKVSLSGGGTGAIIQVDTIGSGSIDEIIVDDGGTNYEVGDVVNFSLGNASAKVAVVNGGFTPEDSIEDHIILEDETVKGDIYTGNKVVQESGLGDITDIRIIENGNGYISLPSLTITSSSGNGAFIYAYGSEIGRVLQIKNVEYGFDHNLSPSPTLTLPSNLLLKNRTGTFTEGETITGEDASSTLITATVLSLDSDTNVLKLINASGTFAEDTIITGSSSLQTATIVKVDQANATATVSSVIDTDGSFINEDGFTSESSMKIQDSLLYQDYSYIVSVGRSISEWRNSYTQTLHPSGFYFQGEFTLESIANARLRDVTGINKSVTEEIFMVLKTIFSTILRRKLGTLTDNTTLRVNPALGTAADLDPATSNHFETNTRDVTLRSTQNFKLVSTPKYDIRNDRSNYGTAYAGPRMNNLNMFWRFYSGVTHTGTVKGITPLTFAHLNNHRLTGTLSFKSGNRYNGQVITWGELAQKNLRTYIAMPTEISNIGATTFDNTSTTFDGNTDTFDEGSSF